MSKMVQTQGMCVPEGSENSKRIIIIYVSFVLCSCFIIVIVLACISSRARRRIKNILLCRCCWKICKRLKRPKRAEDDYTPSTDQDKPQEPVKDTIDLSSTIRAGVHRDYQIDGTAATDRNTSRMMPESTDRIRFNLKGDGPVIDSEHIKPGLFNKYGGEKDPFQMGPVDKYRGKNKPQLQDSVNSKPLKGNFISGTELQKVAAGSTAPTAQPIPTRSTALATRLPPPPSNQPVFPASVNMQNFNKRIEEDREGEEYIDSEPNHENVDYSLEQAPEDDDQPDGMNYRGTGESDRRYDEEGYGPRDDVTDRETNAGNQ